MKFGNVLQRLVLGLSAALMLPAGTALADIVTITFDDAPTGFQTSTYTSSLGVTFSGGLGGINVQPYSLSSGTFPGLPLNFYNAGNQSVFLNNAGNTCCADTPPVIATFAQDVSNVSMIFADTEQGSVLGRMKAFDAVGNLLADTGPVITPSTTYPGFQVLALNVGGIHSIQFYSDWDGAVVDNLTFTTVPEPASLVLLGLGLAGLGFSRRKKEKQPAS